MMGPKNSFRDLSARMAGDHEERSAPTYRLEDFDLIRDKKGLPVWNTENALTLLRDHADWRGVPAYDQFKMRRILLKPIPGERDVGCPRPLADEDYTATQAWFNRVGFPTATKDIVVDALRKVCGEYPFDPLTDYLEGLRWDGIARLPSWLIRYCGAEVSPYTCEVGIRWCIAAVARAFEPGCKADHMLVLESTQGMRKSTALATLAGAEWFSDSLPPMQTKDASSFLRGRWIVEVAELEAMRRDVDAVKAFISRQAEAYRPPYGREEVFEPRRCVFAGTTNKADWQRDETGGRRFWPVKVGEIDINLLQEDRDQLWAEAVVLYRNGERWWLEGDVAEMALAEAGDRRPEDPWRTDIAEIVSDVNEIATKQILVKLGFVSADMTPALSKRVARELVALGWHNAGRFTYGEFKGAARYIVDSNAIAVGR